MKSTEKRIIPSFTFDDIRELAYAFQKSRILLTAYELDLFTVLGKELRTSSEVACAVGADARATDRLMNALCAMGLLTKEDGRFSNAQAASRFLVRGEPRYMAGLMHTVNLWDTWSTLTQAVRQGTATAHREVNGRRERWLTAFVAAMHARASREASTVVAEIGVSAVSRVLDVGGGSGAYAAAFVRAGDGIRATVFDLPNVVPLTRTYVEQAGLLDKIDITAGDYLTDDLGSGYDLVFLSAIIHSNSAEQNRSLVKKCARALSLGGRVIVQDFIMNEDRTSPPRGAFFALNMLVGTPAGDTYTEAEVRTWMEEAGLSAIVRKETPFGSTQIVGRKLKN
jgi:SAM-dependent methyltransferase